jgi:hypothetical protein
MDAPAAPLPAAELLAAADLLDESEAGSTWRHEACAQQGRSTRVGRRFGASSRTGGAFTMGAEAEEILDLGNGVTLAVLIFKSRPAGSGGEVRMRYAAVEVWVEGLVVSITNYVDIDEARAAAERLAESRG